MEERTKKTAKNDISGVCYFRTPRPLCVFWPLSTGVPQEASQKKVKWNTRNAHFKTDRNWNFTQTETDRNCNFTQRLSLCLSF